MFRKTCALALSTLMLLSIFSTGNLTRAMGKSREEENTIVASEEEEQDVPFYGKKTVDGILVSVKADAGVFPKKAKLKVKKLSQKVDKKKVEEKVEEKLKEEDAELLESFIFDISVLDAEGEELQPNNEKGDVKVSFERLNILAKGKELAVFHLDEPDAEPEKLGEVEVKEEEKSVELKAEHFSLFVVSLIDRNIGQMETGSLGLEEGEEGDLNDFVHKGDRFIWVLEASSDPIGIVELIIEPTYGNLHVKALKEGKTTITVKNKVWENGSDVIKERKYEIIVHKPVQEGRLGKNMKYRISGEGNNMTLFISGYGEGDYRENAPWLPYKNRIKRLVIEEGIENLGISDSAFMGMKNLESVILPSTLREIPEYTFAYCNNLGDLTIPASVETIGRKAFYKEGSDARHNTIINQSSVYLLEQGMKLHYNDDFTTVKQNAKKKTEEKYLDITIESFRLYQVPSLHKSFLELKMSGNSDTRLSDYYLFKTEDPNKQVSRSDFMVSQYEFKPGLKVNGWRKYKGNHNWKAYYYADVSEENWQEGHSYYCYILLRQGEDGGVPQDVDIFKTKITVGAGTKLPMQDGDLTWTVEKLGTSTPQLAKYKLSVGGNGAIRDCTLENGPRAWNKLLYAMRMENKTIQLELQNGITKIGSDAFSSLEDIESEVTAIEGNVKIPESVSEIGTAAFLGLDIRGELQFTPNLKKIGRSAFFGIKHEGELNLPEGLEVIEEEAFRGYNVRNVIIPSTVKHIGTAAFYKDEIGLNGFNTIVNHSAVKLSNRHANPQYTHFELDDSAEESTVWTGRSRGRSYGGSAGGFGGGEKVSVAGGNSSQKINWKKDSKGWWIQNEDGSYPKNEWKLINKSWYFFNKEGYMSTGWIFRNNTWYYLEGGENENNGKMSTGWKLLNGTWYYLSKEEGANNGKMLTGWQLINGRWYYLSTEEGINNGKMLTGWRLINGKWYYFSTEAGINNGKMLFNTVVDGYTLKEDGSWDTQKKKAG